VSIQAQNPADGILLSAQVFYQFIQGAIEDLFVQSPFVAREIAQSA
jgi:hypothetical protein